LSLAALAALCSQSPFAAAGANNLFAPETDMFVVLNLRQLLDSELSGKYLLPGLRQALDKPEGKEIFGAVGLDPLRDLDRITIAGPMKLAGTDSRSLLVLSGRFDVKKIAAVLDAEAKKDPTKLTTVREGSVTLFKALYSKQAEPLYFYFAFADDRRFVVGVNPKFLARTLERAAKGEVWGIDNKQVADALASVHPKSTFYAYQVGGLASGSIPGLAPENQAVSKLFEKTTGATLDIRVADGVRLLATFHTTDADAAKELKVGADQYLTQLKTLLPLLTASRPPLKPLVQAANTLKLTAKGPTVVLKGEITAKDLAAVDKALTNMP
jgi:hypothetical protein